MEDATIHPVCPWMAHRCALCVGQGNGGGVLGVLGGHVDLQRCSFRNGTGGIKELARVRLGHTSLTLEASRACVYIYYSTTIVWRLAVQCFGSG